MFICLTNHQPKPKPASQNVGLNVTSFEDILTQMGLAPPPPNGDSRTIVMELPNPPAPIPNDKTPKKPKSLLVPEMPKDNAPVYLNIEPSDVIALSPTRFGGTELVYLCPQQSANVPEAMGGDNLIQKVRRSIFVKEPPSQIAAMLKLKAIGA